jgi:hypothetical protein
MLLDTDRRRHDPRVSWALTVAGLVLGGLLTSAAVSLIGMKSNLAVLLDRPVGVPREEYARDRQRADNDLADVKTQLANVQNEIGKIRDEQQRIGQRVK